MPDNSENSEIAVLKDWRTRVDQQLTEIKDSIKQGNEALSQQIANLDKKFAAKWVQTVVAGLIAAILLAFVGGLTALLIHAPAITQPTVSVTPSK